MKIWLCAFVLLVSTSAAHGQIVDDGLILDLDANQDVDVQDVDRVVKWTNQVAKFTAQEFVQRDEGRRQPGAGRPTLKKSVAAIGGRNTLVFRGQELINHNEDAFDQLLTGNGYTWFAVISCYEQTVGLKDVNSFFGNLKNGGNYEGIWGSFTDDNRLWIGARNGFTFGRWDKNNPMVLVPQPLEANRFYVLAGRMGAGTNEVRIEAFVHNETPAASEQFPVNPKADSSKLAIGQERDATNHPGQEAFDGELARFLVYERPLADDELRQTMAQLKRVYKLER
jgi:hypothetical protein